MYFIPRCFLLFLDETPIMPLIVTNEHVVVTPAHAAGRISSPPDRALSHLTFTPCFSATSAVIATCFTLSRSLVDTSPLQRQTSPIESLVYINGTGSMSGSHEFEKEGNWSLYIDLIIHKVEALRTEIFPDWRAQFSTWGEDERSDFLLQFDGAKVHMEASVLLKLRNAGIHAIEVGANLTHILPIPDDESIFGNMKKRVATLQNQVRRDEKRV